MAQWGRISVWDAAADGNLDKIKQKLANGIVAPDEQDANGKTPLMEAARWGYLEVVKYLKEQGADIKKTTTEGSTPLHIAAEGGHVNIVTFFLDSGAEIDIKNNEGNTPLMGAAGRNQPDVVRFLISRGANPKLENRNHKTAHDLSPNSNFTDALNPGAKYLSPTKY